MIMGQREIHNKEVTARKNHNEMMSEWFRNDLRELCGEGLSFAEWRSIARLKANGWEIQKGQRCHVFVGIDCDGQIYRGYYLKEINDIVCKYDLWEDVC